jgi:uncharacterized membrane protein
MSVTEENIMAKTASFAVIHFTVAFSVGYALTGSLVVGSALALIEPAINTVAFYFHELVWKKIEAKRTVQSVDQGLQAQSG